MRRMDAPWSCGHDRALEVKIMRARRLRQLGEHTSEGMQNSVTVPYNIFK